MSVTDEAIAKIRDLITGGRLNPGDRVPPEQELAALLGISRSSLREAVKALSQAKVLYVRRGDGTYVSSLEPRLLLSGLGFAVDLMQDKALQEIFEVRRLLEPAATALAAQRISDAQVATLYDSLADMKGAQDPEELVMRDMDFHARIAEASGNASLCSILEAVDLLAARAGVAGVDHRGQVHDPVAARDDPQRPGRPRSQPGPVRRHHPRVGVRAVAERVPARVAERAGRPGTPGRLPHGLGLPGVPVNLAHLLLGSAQRVPDAPAVLSGDRVVSTFRGLAASVAGRAATLSRVHGVGPGSRVALYASNGPEYLELLLAVWRTGATAVPLSALLHAREAPALLEDSGARLLVLSADTAPRSARTRGTAVPVTVDDLPVSDEGSRRAGAAAGHRRRVDLLHLRDDRAGPRARG